VAVDVVRDIALISFDPSAVQLEAGARPIPLGAISIEDNASPLMALGYSGAGVKLDGTVGRATANQGILSQIIQFPNFSFGQNLVIDAAVDPGDSGGPVLNAEGLVVGMVRSAQISLGGQRVVGTFYAVHVAEIQDALVALKQGRSRLN